MPISRAVAFLLSRMRVTYYDITLDDVYLDDDNLSQYPRLRLSGDHSSIRPQVGERFLFVLGANPDGKSYGVTADWNLIHLDGGPVRNFDGKSTGYVGVVDEGSLKDAVRAAVPKRVHLPMDQWPVQQKWLADENTPSGTPPSPGGDGATGPVGVASAVESSFLRSGTKGSGTKGRMQVRPCICISVRR